MKSQTSYFNRALIKSNLKRYGYLGILFFVFICVIGNIGVLLNGVGRYQVEDIYKNLDMSVPNPFDIAMVFVVPVIFGIVLFRYVMEERALSTIHAMPVSRRSLFYSQFITFGLLYGLPIVVNGLISYIILLTKGYPLGMVSGRVGYSILILFLSGCAVFALTVLFGMMVGSSVLQTALVYILMGAPFVIVELSRVLVRWTLKGYPEYQSGEALHHYLTPYYSIVVAAVNEGSDFSKTAWAFFMVVIFTGIAGFGSYILYQRRPLEKHTELITFKWAKIFFVGLLTLMMTLSLSTLIGSMMDLNGAYIGLVFGSLLGFAIMKMIAEKTVSVLIYWKQALLVTGAFVLALIAVDLDFFGYEDRVPEVDDIAYVFYKEDMWSSVKGIDGMEDSLIDNRSGGVFRNALTIDYVRNIHYEAIEDDTEAMEVWHDFTVIYVLKSGREIHRVYNVAIDPENIKVLHESAEYKQMNMSLMTENILDGHEAVTTIAAFNGQNRIVEGNELMTLLDAYEMDYSRMSYIESLGYNQIGYVEVAVVDRVKYNGDNRSEQRSVYTYPIYPSFEMVKNWMLAHDMPQSLPKIEQVTSAVISPWYGLNFVEPTNDLMTIEDQSVDAVYKETVYIAEEAITDQAQLEELFNLGYDYTRMYEDAYNITFTIGTGGSYTVRVVDLPQAYMDDVRAW